MGRFQVPSAIAWIIFFTVVFLTAIFLNFIFSDFFLSLSLAMIIISVVIVATEEDIFIDYCRFLVISSALVVFFSFLLGLIYSNLYIINIGFFGISLVAFIVVIFLLS